MEQKSHSKWHSLWVLPPIVLAIGIFVFMVSGKQAPQQLEQGEPVRFVRTITVTEGDFTPVVEGYGSVQPAKVWTAVTQVSGRIINMHARLRDGEIITAGTELFRIDPVDYELALLRARAELAELNTQGENSVSLLKIEQRNLALAEQEFERQKKLADQGTGSRSRADEAERAMLGSRASLQNLENTVALIPIQRQILQVRIIQAERDLANTQLFAPFNMRVSGLSIETDQFVSKGQVLLAGDSVDRVEVIAQVSLFDLKNLFIDQPDIPLNFDLVKDNIAQISGFVPTIKMDIGNDQMAEWEAEFVRLSDRVDSQTRTMGVVVAVDNPMRKAIPGIRPPLSKGMFVQVAIAGHVQQNKVIIPRAAIRNDKVYVVNPQSRLETRTVERLYNQQQFAIIGSGLKTGDQVVVSDLMPAVDGMLLQASTDEMLQQSLVSGN
ncbi:MAG: efflux RND transporter periplasmic adaptor subunit [Gammaproteobacteria bacterium]|nr:efflux RND transporter periplasmic adaptor subunit [Gammaproteobacteria bacterium]